ncbi:MAG: hypothetical protein K0Q90_1684 [Paenibacillaceae bacterium]|jgi:hypothetical protein|nr:hypothetical protein [Paenibacillaceae bacterium]
MKKRLERWLPDRRDRAAVTALAAFVMNVLIGAGKLVLGVYLHSAWFIINAIYYLVLSLVRGLTLRYYAEARKIGEPAERYGLEFAVYQKSGMFLCLLGLSYMAVCIRMYMVGDAVVFGGNIVFLIALVAFTKLGLAIHGNVVNRHLKNPIVSVLKMINFTDAMVSIVITQYTLLVMGASSSAMSSSALFGMGCSVLFIGIGIFMICRRNVRLNPEPDCRDGGQST